MTNRDRIEVIQGLRKAVEIDIQLAETELRRLSGIMQPNPQEAEKIGYCKGRIGYAKSILCVMGSLPQKIGL